MAKSVVPVPAAIAGERERALKARRARSRSALVSVTIDAKRERDMLAEVLDVMDALMGPPDAEAVAWARRVMLR